jgi:hypothetical protein
MLGFEDFCSNSLKMGITTVANILAAVVGVLGHVLYFNRGEHHLYSMKYFLAHVSAIGLMLSGPLVGGQKFEYSCNQVLLLALSYFTGLYSSLFLYRVFFHPLNQFPRPIAARWTSLWFSYQSREGRAHKKVLELHKQYGDFVRIGSSDLSITHPEGVATIYGPNSLCIKGGWYDLAHPIVSLQTQRDLQKHKRHRRIWSDAFSDKALRGYEERTKVYRAQLTDHISESAADGKLVDVTKWFSLFGFDLMGDLVFGSSFNMLQTSEEHWAIAVMQKGLKVLGLHFPMWFFRFVMAIPGLGKDRIRSIEFCFERLEERIKVGSLPFRQSIDIALARSTNLFKP